MYNSLFFNAWKPAAFSAIMLTTLCSLHAQTNAALSGTVTFPSDMVAPNADVSVRDLLSGRTAETHTNADGMFSVLNLRPGDYDVSVRVEGFAVATARVSLLQGTAGKVDLKLASPPLSTGPSLADLGISPDQTQGSAKDQARLNKRAHMLLIHQRLGLITAAPLIATLISSGGAGGRNSGTSGRRLHAALGIATTDLYFTTAYFAVFAPKVPGTTTRGQIRLHRTLAWIHGAGFIVTPILGSIAYNQRSAGEKVHGIAKMHGAAAWTTGLAYGAAIFSVSFKL